MANAESPDDVERKASASERLLDAAALVFARDGIGSATTREIARTAGVNEVTLFRNFQTKQNLLAAVIERAFETKSNPEAEHFAALPKECDLAEFVHAFARMHHSNMSRHVSLMRVLLGEIQHFQEHEIRVLREIFRPRRDQLLERLQLARQTGEARPDFDPNIIVDQLAAMIFMGVLKSGSPMPPEYDPASYVSGCAETTLRAIIARP